LTNHTTFIDVSLSFSLSNLFPIKPKRQKKLLTSTENHYQPKSANFDVDSNILWDF